MNLGSLRSRKMNLTIKVSVNLLDASRRSWWSVRRRLDAGDIFGKV